jgi:hypothetical protein
MSRTGSIVSREKAIASAMNAGLLFKLTYMNAVFTTITVTIFFTRLFSACKEVNKDWAYIGIMFIPIYSILNILVYLSQVTVIPRLIAQMDISGNTEVYKIILSQFVQGWSGSMMFVMNQTAYMILGIPSILFGSLVVKHIKSHKVFGFLLLFNGIACVIGGIGTVLDNQLFSTASVIGGVIFLLALLTVVINPAPLSVSFSTKNV